MKFTRSRRKAVAPVLATLMMIAVAVAMSVIIFVWSQGFLSQTSSAAGGQQGQQNIAAQSSLSIESATFTTGTSGTVTLVIRNVGAVSEQFGSLLVQGNPSNSGLQISIVCTSFTSSAVACTPSGTSGATSSSASGTGTSTTPLAKAGAATVTVTLGSALSLTSGDIINLKISTTVGTFATQQFTIP